MKIYIKSPSDIKPDETYGEGALLLEAIDVLLQSKFKVGINEFDGTKMTADEIIKLLTDKWEKRI